MCGRYGQPNASLVDQYAVELRQYLFRRQQSRMFTTQPISTWINSIQAQGWDLVPTWVGLQAPGSSCTSCSKMSSSTATAPFARAYHRAQIQYVESVFQSPLRSARKPSRKGQASPDHFVSNVIDSCAQPDTGCPVNEVSSR